MGAPIDLTGQRFGKLVVQELAAERPRRWRCLCDCGNETIVTTHDLRGGSTRSCGCLKREREDLTGQRFGRLVAIERAGIDARGHSLWRCQCDCGNEVTVRIASLKSGNTRSCGCLVSDKVCELSDAVDDTRLSGLGNNLTRQNTSGIRGVSRRAKDGRWEAHIKFGGRKISLGLYKTMQEAAEARREAEIEYFDPVLEAHGLPPTSEEEYQENLRRALERENGDK